MNKKLIFFFPEVHSALKKQFPYKKKKCKILKNLIKSNKSTFCGYCSYQWYAVYLYLTALTVRWPKLAWPLLSVFWPAGTGANCPITNKTHLVNCRLHVNSHIKLLSTGTYLKPSVTVNSHLNIWFIRRVSKLITELYCQRHWHSSVIIHWQWLYKIWREIKLDQHSHSQHMIQHVKQQSGGSQICCALISYFSSLIRWQMDNMIVCSLLTAASHRTSWIRGEGHHALTTL